MAGWINLPWEDRKCTGQQAGPSDKQLEVEFIRCQVGSWTGEDGVGTLLLGVQHPVRFSWGGTKTAGCSKEESDVDHLV